MIKKLLMYLLSITLICYGVGFAIIIAYNKGDLSSVFASNRININDNKYISSNNSDSNKSSTDSGVKSGTQTTDEEKNEPIASIKNITVHIASGNIHVISENRSDVRAHLYGTINSSSSSKPTLETSIVEDTLNIDIKNQITIIGFSNIDLSLDVYIPSSYSNNIKLTSTSGDISIDNFTLSSLDCALTSGNFKFDKLTADDFIYKSSSGDFTAHTLITKKSDITSTSGKIEISDFTGDLKSSSTSGDINICYSKFNNNADINVTSGDVMLKLPENAEFTLSAKATSGDVNCEFPITISGKKKDNNIEGTVKNDKNKVTIKTISGDITIKK
jgi:Uncharacterized conserved protein